MAFKQQTYFNIFKKKKYFLEFLSNVILAFCLVVSLFIIGFSIIYSANSVIGVSMQPTLNPKGRYKSDIVYVNRFAKIERGDIVVLHETAFDDDEYLIKRVIAIGGDRINIVKNMQENTYELWLNGKILDESSYLYEYKLELDNNNLGMESTYNNFITFRQYNPFLFENDTLIIPKGEVFVLGDNRGKSVDSSIVGPFDITWVVGRVDFIIPYGNNTFNFFISTFTPFNL